MSAEEIALIRQELSNAAELLSKAQGKLVAAHKPTIANLVSSIVGKIESERRLLESQTVWNDKH